MLSVYQLGLVGFVIFETFVVSLVFTTELDSKRTVVVPDNVYDTAYVPVQSIRCNPYTFSIVDDKAHYVDESACRALCTASSACNSYVVSGLVDKMCVLVERCDIEKDRNHDPVRMKHTYYLGKSYSAQTTRPTNGVYTPTPAPTTFPDTTNPDTVNPNAFYIPQNRPASIGHNDYYDARWHNQRSNTERNPSYTYYQYICDPDSYLHVSKSNRYKQKLNGAIIKSSDRDSALWACLITPDCNYLLWQYQRHEYYGYRECRFEMYRLYSNTFNTNDKMTGVVYPVKPDAGCAMYTTEDMCKKRGGRSDALQYVNIPCVWDATNAECKSKGPVNNYQ